MSDKVGVGGFYSRGNARYSYCDHRILGHPHLSIYAKAVYQVLEGFRLGKSLSFPGQKTIAAILRISERKTRDAVYELQDYGFITIRKGRDGNLYDYVNPDAVFRESLRGVTKEAPNKILRNPNYAPAPCAGFVFRKPEGEIEADLAEYDRQDMPVPPAGHAGPTGTGCRLRVSKEEEKEEKKNQTPANGDTAPRATLDKFSATAIRDKRLKERSEALAARNREEDAKKPQSVFLQDLLSGKNTSWTTKGKSFKEISEHMAAKIKFPESQGGSPKGLFEWTNQDFINYYRRMVPAIIDGAPKPMMGFKEKNNMKLIKEWLEANKEVKRYMDFCLENWPKLVAKYKITGSVSLGIIKGFGNSFHEDMRKGLGGLGTFRDGSKASEAEAGSWDI